MNIITNNMHVFFQILSADLLNRLEKLIEQLITILTAK
jgi:hypothetical protein